MEIKIKQKYGTTMMTIKQRHSLVILVLFLAPASAFQLPRHHVRGNGALFAELDIKAELTAYLAKRKELGADEKAKE